MTTGNLELTPLTAIRPAVFDDLVPPIEVIEQVIACHDAVCENRPASRRSETVGDRAGGSTGKEKDI